MLSNVAAIGMWHSLHVAASALLLQLNLPPEGQALSCKFN
jgi:hypothetical protein